VYILKKLKILKKLIKIKIKIKININKNKNNSKKTTK